MAHTFIGVGSNIDPQSNIREALIRLAERVEIRALSTFYQSRPVGPPGQPPFVNGVVAADTDLPPLAVKRDVLRRIEEGLGRVRTTDKYAPRVIDLDLLIYDDMVVAEAGLVLPDPEITSRPFLAVPLGELAPELKLPGDGRTMRELAQAFAGHAMTPLAEYTQELKGRVCREP